ncbi:hydrogenase maturation nickel metallochaperone HypA/HybF [Schlesneria paludicola]|uniref:hydrogenase maturation nickel metallochaperone HypA/HybF n=1 Tax=Schlesneria paludicola TaxID=360056 RepID=UPI00029B28E4|nr:hydrogenase maturation nickel metallochaperone HypA [Schlesneria paludicola]
MHELSLAMSILDIAGEESDRRGGAEIKSIYLKLGPLSGVIKQALISAFDLAREMSPFSKVELVVEEVPLRVRCHVCDTERELPCFQDLCCPECGTPCGDVVCGRELEIVAMEIES